MCFKKCKAVITKIWDEFMPRESKINKVLKKEVKVRRLVLKDVEVTL